MSNILMNVLSQRYKNLEVIVVVQGYNVLEKNKLLRKFDETGIKFRIIVLDESVPLGLRRNIGVEIAGGDYIAHMDDDDIYLPAYIDQCLMSLQLGNYDIIGKCSSFYFFRRTGDLYLRYPGQFNIKTYNLRGSSLFYKSAVGKKLSFGESNTGEDTVFLNEARLSRYTAFAVDPFNYIVTRSENVDDHTFKKTEDDYHRESVFMACGINSNVVSYDGDMI